MAFLTNFSLFHQVLVKHLPLARYNARHFRRYKIPAFKEQLALSRRKTSKYVISVKARLVLVERAKKLLRKVKKEEVLLMARSARGAGRLPDIIFIYREERKNFRYSTA